MEITIEQTRYGTFAAFGATESIGLLGTGDTPEAALSAGQAELARRKAAGAAALSAIRAQGRMVAAFADARQELRY